MVSPIWDCFTLTTSSDGKRIAACNLCTHKEPKPVGSCTNPCWRHLEAKHRAVFNKLKTQEKKSDAFNALLTKWIVSANLPFNVVEHEDFAKVLAFVGKRAPSRYTITNKVLPQLEAEVKEQLRIMIKDQNLTITSDVWSHGEISLVSLTGHWLDIDFSPHTAILAVRLIEGRHTASNIATVLQSILEEYEINDQVSGCTTDAAATMLAAVNRMDKTGISCSSHQLHLSVSGGLAEWSKKNLISKCKNFATLIHHSNLARSRLRSELEITKNRIRGVPRDISIRWNSTFYLIDSIVEKIPECNVVLKEWKRDIITDEEAVMLRKLRDFLKNFLCVTLELCKENSPASCIIGLFTLMVNICKNTRSNSTCDKISELAEIIEQDLQRRLNKYKDNVFLLAVTFTDPRFANNKEMLPTAKNVAINNILKDLAPQDCPSSAVRSDENSQNLYDMMETMSSATSPIPASIDVEISRYQSELMASPIPMKSCPLQWWKINGRRFPILSSIARRLLALQSTSVQSERLFSRCGLMFNNTTRNRLSGAMVERSMIVACFNMAKIARTCLAEPLKFISLRREEEELGDDEEEGCDTNNE